MGVTDAMVQLDAWASLTTERDMFTSDEILDFILDVRQTLTAIEIQSNESELLTDGEDGTVLS